MAALVLGTSLLLTGCGGNNNAAEEPAAEENTAQEEPLAPLTVSGTADKGRNIDFIRTPVPGDGLSSSEEVTPEPAFSAPTGDELADPDEAAPQFFDVEDPVDNLMGYNDNDMCDQLIKELNARRTAFAVGTLTKNTSLCVAADVRGREYALYPVYKERPDGRPFTSISPQGYVKDEYFVIPARNSVTPKWDASKGAWTNPSPSYKEYTYTPYLVVEGLMEIREARNILMNENYKQVGATWFVTGSYFIAGFTLSY